MRTLLLASSLFFCLSLFSQQNIAPDFSLEDTDGVTHNLYADYLDQGKTVYIYLGAVWAPFDQAVFQTNVFQNFQSEFVPSGNAVLLYIDPTNPSLEDFMGTGQQNQNYDYISNTNFPLIGTGQQFSDDYAVEYFPSMRMICPDRTYITDGDDPSLFYTEIESAQYIADKMFEHCGTEFDLASIEGQVYMDENIDCVQDPNEQTNLHNIKAIIEGPTGAFTRYTSDAGVFKMFASEGDYAINVCPPNDLWSVCNNPQNVSITDLEQKESVALGLQIDTDCSRIEAQITSPILRRCFTSQVIVDYCNTGTLPAEDAFLEVELDEYMIFENSVPDPTFVNGSTLMYELGTVPVLECGRVHIFVEIACDTILGLEQCYTVNYGPIENCDNKDADSETECQEIRGAYDPNDKRAFPLSGSDDYKILPNEEIKYQIRFQNTGTDTAFNIVVEDVISPHLDITTFRRGASSHPYEVDIDDGRKATFRFDNIMLPDSNVNLAGSNGFINYYISQNSDLENGVHITNQAAIYFDFNEPIWTNVTDHEVDDGISVTFEPKEMLLFNLAPNPAVDRIDIEVSDTEWVGGTLTLLDLNGKTLLSEKISDTEMTLELEGVENGLYLVHLKSPSGKQGSQKLTVIK